MIKKPLHPGEIVKEVCIDSTGLTVADVAKKLGIDRTTFSRLINKHAGISPEMALRLSKLLGTSIEMWINLQAQYDAWEITLHTKKIKVKPLYKDKAA